MGQKKKLKKAKKEACEAIMNADAFILTTNFAKPTEEDPGQRESYTHIVGPAKQVAECAAGVESALEKSKKDILMAAIKEIIQDIKERV